MIYSEIKLTAAASAGKWRGGVNREPPITPVSLLRPAGLIYIFNKRGGGPASYLYNGLNETY